MQYLWLNSGSARTVSFALYFIIAFGLFDLRCMVIECPFVSDERLRSDFLQIVSNGRLEELTLEAYVSPDEGKALELKFLEMLSRTTCSLRKVTFGYSIMEFAHSYVRRENADPSGSAENNYGWELVKWDTVCTRDVFPNSVCLSHLRSYC
jgi:hypothetical protein